MTAYVLADVEVTDPELFDTYRAGTAATVEQYGGAFAVRGGDVEVREGAWRPGRLVVLQFPDMDAARAGTTLRSTRRSRRSGSARPSPAS